MDERLRRLERRAATGDPRAREHLFREQARAGKLTKFVPKRLVGPGGALTRACAAWIEKDGTADQFIRFAAAIAAKHGTEFGCYCIGQWGAGGKSLPALIRSARDLARGENSGALTSRFLRAMRDALDH